VDTLIESTYLAGLVEEVDEVVAVLSVLSVEEAEEVVAVLSVVPEFLLFLLLLLLSIDQLQQDHLVLRLETVSELWRISSLDSVASSIVVLLSVLPYTHDVRITYSMPFCD
jgi:uncharacterized membrane protein YkvI